MRLFAALYPGAAAGDHLELALSSVGAHETRLAGGSPPVRWVPRELWHVTVSFFGEVPDGAVPDLTDVLARVAGGVCGPQLALHGAGVFDARVLWVGVGGDREPVGGLRDLSRDVADAAEDVGLRPDRRPRRRAHLTVGRVGGRERGAARRAARRGPDRGAGTASTATDTLVAAASALAVYEGPRWDATELVLVASDVDHASGRVVHHRLERLAFTTGTPPTAG
ncbi:RNA 2',3'-cyclic phosphodiesterase [Cellulosimicrobium arenosum]|uniref:RNA 2',3'-cyclic phosphodiesterase n=1 Tax=Cellulosimicrobium arenosum TaxID=2708133 RepID=A0A927G957_9MICO|nr:RNA 2',3'-cyclic phosphodiesterase [Cellulosimicrobium arenosum]